MLYDLTAGLAGRHEELWESMDQALRQSIGTILLRTTVMWQSKLNFITENPLSNDLKSWNLLINSASSDALAGTNWLTRQVSAPLLSSPGLPRTNPQTCRLSPGMKPYTHDLSHHHFLHPIAFLIKIKKLYLYGSDGLLSAEMDLFKRPFTSQAD